MSKLFSATGTAVWYGTSRVVCEADTDKMAQFIADALNHKDKQPPAKR
jgi:hypothetical protein